MLEVISGVIAFVATSGIGYFIFTKKDRELKEGIFLYKTKKYKEALIIFKELNRKGYKQSKVWFDKSEAQVALINSKILFEQKRYKEAEDNLLNLVDSEKVTTDFKNRCHSHILYNQAKIYFDKGDFIKAKSILNDFNINPARDLQRLCEANIVFNDTENSVGDLSSLIELKKAIPVLRKIVNIVNGASTLLNKVEKESNYIEGVNNYRIGCFEKSFTYLTNATDKPDTKKYLYLVNLELTLIKASKSFDEKRYDECISFLNGLDNDFKVKVVRSLKIKSELEIGLNKGIVEFNNSNFDKAKLVFQSLIDNHNEASKWLKKTNEELDLINGIRLFKDSKFEEALVIFKECNHKNSSKWKAKSEDEILYASANEYFKHEEYKKAFSIANKLSIRLEKAKELRDISKANYEFIDGIVLFRENKLLSYEKALKLFNSSSKHLVESKKWIVDTEVEINYLNGISEYNRANFKKALSLFKLAKSKKETKEQIVKTEAEINFIKAVDQFKFKNFKLALDLFENIKESHLLDNVSTWIERTKAEIKLEKGISFFKSKEYVKAEAIFEEIKGGHQSAKSWLQKASEEVLFEKGCNLFLNNKLDEALEIFTKSRHKESASWKQKTQDEILFIEGVTLFNLEDYEKAVHNFKIISDRVEKAKTWLEKAETEVKYSKGLKAFEKGNYLSCLDTLKTIKIVHKGTDELLDKLIIKFYEVGKKHEVELNYSLATKYYNYVVTEQEYLQNKLLINEVNCRLLIVKIKIGSIVSEYTISIAKCNKRKIKQDLQYRWIYSLYERKEYESLAMYLPKYFKDSTNTSILFIENKIKEHYYQLLQNNVEFINNLTKVDLSFSRSRVKYGSLAKNYKEIIYKIEELRSLPILSDVEIKNLPKYTNQVKEKYFSELIKSGIDNHEYLLVLNFIIKEKPKYYTSIELINNIAICSANIVADGKLTSINYKSVISNWLTAVYMDDLVLHSLIHTTWDDNYTFSAFNTLGWLNDTSLITENIIAHEHLEAIQVRSSQEELIKIFENNFNKANYSESFLTFYNIEKESIVELLSYKSKMIKSAFIGTPNFLIGINKNKEITNTLVKEYEHSRKKDEGLLRLANKYSIATNKPILLKEYDILIKYENDLIAAFRKLNLTKLSRLSTGFRNVAFIRFSDRSSILQNSLFDIFTSLKETIGYEVKLWESVKYIFKLIPEHEMFTHSFADYTNKMVVSLSQKGKITNIDSIKFLLDVLEIDNDHQANENLKVVFSQFIVIDIEQNYHDATQSELNLMYKVIDRYSYHQTCADLMQSGIMNNSTSIKSLLSSLIYRYPNIIYKEIEPNAILQNAINKSNDGHWNTKRTIDELIKAAEIRVTNRIVENLPIVFENLFSDAFQGVVSISIFETRVRKIVNLRNTGLNRALRSKYSQVKKMLPPGMNSVVSSVEIGNTHGITPDGIRMAKAVIAFKNI